MYQSYPFSHPNMFNDTAFAKMLPLTWAENLFAQGYAESITDAMNESTDSTRLSFETEGSAAIHT